ncbi:transporter substrate-binding domain-containing protein [Actibacterium sp. 188UL27-1]|uniref:transporter substrate-binding domain-containing protein n=1 Tax=Actibacterium sp. 188UL27-1 TaxID=2786961 RepID=UPI00195D7B33|nr:transporter substrate-binding domain-containing protein [Actibacterium sp. 188UL27-1]MBM7069939.1 transporter substrate-binding domain-containing protein [Actibacterium sp. 188UL27-1]
MKFAHIIERPFNHREPSGAVMGCDVDLAQAANNALASGPWQPIETTFQKLLPGLGIGDWDMTTAMFATEDRRKTAWLGPPIWALTGGLMMKAGKPLGLCGYGDPAAHPTARLAVSYAQIQHGRALDAGIPAERITLFDDYGDAAAAVAQGKVDAYTSVSRAHRGYLDGEVDHGLDCVDVSTDEAPASFGAFALSLSASELQRDLDDFLAYYLGSPSHRQIMACYGFSDQAVNLIAG